MADGTRVVNTPGFPEGYVPPSASLAPPPVDTAEAARLAEAEQYLRGVIKNGNLLAGGRRLLPVLLAEYDRRGAALDAARTEVELLRAVRERALHLADGLDRTADQIEADSRPSTANRAFYAGLVAVGRDAARRLRRALEVETDA